MEYKEPETLLYFFKVFTVQNSFLRDYPPLEMVSQKCNKQRGNIIIIENYIMRVANKK